MSLLAPLPIYADYPEVFRFSVERYHAMIEAGILTSDDRVELIEGVLVFKMPKDELHAATDGLIDDLLRSLLPSGYFYRNQSPITLEDGEPEPDGAVIKGDRRDYVRFGRKPGPQDAPIVIEVADSTLARDRGIKLRSYARAGIAVYWLVNLIDRVVEVYTDPDPLAAEPTYRDKKIYDAAASVPIVIDGREVAQAPVASILP
jgi:Uma2 family endonuclease